MTARILRLTLHRHWFDMIASGRKTCEYREVKPYWISRLYEPGKGFRKFDAIQFRNGYAKDAPFMEVEWRFTRERRGLFIIGLGRILNIENWPEKGIFIF